LGSNESELCIDSVDSIIDTILGVGKKNEKNFFDGDFFGRDLFWKND